MLFMMYSPEIKIKSFPTVDKVYKLKGPHMFTNNTYDPKTTYRFNFQPRIVAGVDKSFC